MVTDASGNVVESTSYDPWGEVKSGGTANKFLYTGQEHDGETGLNYYNARYYDSSIRRFTQPDPLIQNIYDPQSLNRYSYVRNNPLRYTDPMGYAWWEDAWNTLKSLVGLKTEKKEDKYLSSDKIAQSYGSNNIPLKTSYGGSSTSGGSLAGGPVFSGAATGGVGSNSSQSSITSSGSSSYTNYSPAVKTVVKNSPPIIGTPVAASYAYSINEKVRREARNKFGYLPPIDGGKEDAWRHARWMEILVQDTGYTNALLIGTGHEFQNMIQDPFIRGLQPQNYKMDLYNNYVGAMGAMNGMSPDQLLQNNVLYYHNR